LNFNVAKVFETAVDESDENVSEEEIRKFDDLAKENIENEILTKEVDIVAMLMQIMSHPEVVKETENLLLIDWETSEILVDQKRDLLTPFLIVKFLKLLQDIVKKGLKKSYYKVQENLNNRIKGKILIGKQIKHNILKNRLTNTVCEYQVFGEDSIENRFLKKAFLFCTRYIENNSYYFKEGNNIFWMINYIRPSFENISDNIHLQELKKFKHNPFFKEYKEAIKIGEQILKRFSYNITKTTGEKVSTPPFWIDMPKLFELFVFSKLLKDNPDLNTNNFNYQFSTHGNSLDFLICTDDKKIVVDTKYKLHYNYGQIHEDIRQISGYARLTKVKNKLPKIENEIPCLIIYPKFLGDQRDGQLKITELLNNKINAYHEVYKIGIDLPFIDIS